MLTLRLLALFARVLKVHRIHVRVGHVVGVEVRVVFLAPESGRVIVDGRGWRWLALVHRIRI